MNRLKDRIVLITGASAGIGAATARCFAGHGAHLILVARRSDRLHALGSELAASHGVKVRTEALDVRDREAVEALARRLEGEGVAIDILVNNAGLARRNDRIFEGRFEDWDAMLDTNVKGVLAFVRAFVPGMIARDRGHVIMVGSIAGYQVYPGGSVYNASKFAARALNEGLNVDLAGTAVRASTVDPGLVETEFSEVRFDGDAGRAAGVYTGYEPLQGEDVADAICYVASRPPHVNIHKLMILPTAQRSAHVVHKETPSEAR